MKIKLFLLTILLFIGLTGCHKHYEYPVSISFLSVTQPSYGTSIVTLGDVYIDYYIYNNTYYEINYCSVEFIVHYADSTWEITPPDVTYGIRDHQRNDVTIETEGKKMIYVEVYSVLMNGSGCKYNIISR